MVISHFQKIRTLLICSTIFLFNACSDSDKSGKDDQSKNSSDSISHQKELPDSINDVNQERDEIEFPNQEENSVSKVDLNETWPKINIRNTLGFVKPLDGALELSGSFGELRGNHFHAGLDLRTGGQEGKNVYAIADGVVSRVKVSTRGYGKVLYIRHANGYTSVYGHLKKFNPSIEAYVQKAQYKKRSYEIELFPGQALKVKKGEVIALSGNTGGSAGPHLHFEIRSNKTENTLNPVLYGIPLKDKISPIIYSFIIYEKDEEYRKSTGTYPSRSFKYEQKVVRLKPSTYALGTMNRDHQNDRMNKLDINYSRLIINDELIFTSSIEAIPFDKSRYIQNHYDYYNKRIHHTIYTKFFLEKKNPLPFYKHKNKGFINVEHGDTLNVRIDIADVKSHVRGLKFKIIGDSTARPVRRKKHDSPTLVARSWKNTNYNKNGLKLNIPSRAMYYDTRLRVKSQKNNYSKYSDYYKVHEDIVPLHTYYKIAIQAKNIEGVDKSKLLIINHSKNGRKISEGGTYSLGHVKTKTRSFGNYYIGIDTTAPKVKAKITGRNLYMSVSDDLSGIGEYIVAVDDQWILVEYHPNMKKMIGIIPDWVKAGEHLLEIKVWDKKRNKTYKKIKINL